MEKDTQRKLPVVTVILIGMNLGIWLVLEICGDTQDTEYMLRCGAAYTPYLIERGEWQRMFSCMFLHFGADHLINNMLMLGLMGMRLEYVMGSIPYGLLYILSGLCGSFLSLYQEGRTGGFAVSAGASGAVFGIVGALIAWALWHKGKVEGLSVRGLLGMAALSLYYGFTSADVDNWGHIGGLLGGFLLGCIVSLISKAIDFIRKKPYTIQ